MTSARAKFRSAIHKIKISLAVIRRWRHASPQQSDSNDLDYGAATNSSVTSAHSLASFRFLDLPLEIRQEMYMIVICSEPDISPVHSRKPRLWTTTSVRRLPLIPNLNICRQVKEEAESLYYRTFTFPVSLGANLSQWDWYNQPMENMERIAPKVTTITLLVRIAMRIPPTTSRVQDNFTEATKPKCSPPLRQLQEIFPNLKNVVIELSLILGGAPTHQMVFVNGKSLAEDLGDYLQHLVKGFDVVYLTSTKATCRPTERYLYEISHDDQRLSLHQCSFCRQFLDDFTPHLVYVKAHLDRLYRSSPKTSISHGGAPGKAKEWSVLVDDGDPLPVARNGRLRHSGIWSSGAQWQ